jgi:hypothetical protein
MNATFYVGQTLLWTLLLGLCCWGFGGVFAIRKSLHWVLRLSLGQASLGLFCSFILWFPVDLDIFYPLALGIGCLLCALGLPKAQDLKSCLAKLGLTSWIALLLIFVILLVQWLLTCTPMGGQESFQYHYFIPQLYLEQQSLFLKDFELTEALLNVWGLESLLSFSNTFLGLMGMRVQMWWLYALFIFQIGCGSYWLFQSWQSSYWSMIMAGLCTLFNYFFWWTKPELALVGYCALLIPYWKHYSLKWHTQGSWISAVLLAWLYSLKITFITFTPFLLLLLYFDKRFKLVWVFKIALYTLALLSPWIAFLLMGNSGLGAFPMDNPLHFDAPSGDENLWVQTWTQKYLENMVFTFELYKPASHLFCLGLPFFIYRFKRYALLICGLGANLAGAVLLMKADTPFADEFRYVCFSMFVIPMGAGLVLAYLSRWRGMVPFIFLACSALIAKRSLVQLGEASRHHGAWLRGELSLAHSLSREGALQYQAFLKQKEPEDRLLHVGHGNYAVHGPSVVHVGSWSKKYPLWKADTPKALLQWCQAQNVQWILFERWRYSSYARGFGGTQYVNNRLSKYYQAVIASIETVEDFKVSPSNNNYWLIRLPRSGTSKMPPNQQLSQ